MENLIQSEGKPGKFDFLINDLLISSSNDNQALDSTTKATFIIQSTILGAPDETCSESIGSEVEIRKDESFLLLVDLEDRPRLKISDTTSIAVRRALEVKSLEPATKILLGSIVVIHKSLKRTVYCWQKRVGDYGLSREIKGSVDQIGWKIGMIFENSEAISAEVIERLLEKYETLRQFLKTEEVQVTQENKSDWHEKIYFFNIMKIMEEVSNTLEDVIYKLEWLSKLLKNYQNWQMENIDEVLIEHLIDSKDQMGLLKILQYFMELFRRNSKGLSLWRYLLEEDRFEKILMAVWVRYWIHIFRSSKKCLDKLSTLKSLI
ncbi:expressed protein [Phakopsora pachyrhizi]|uniref:Expressed protein n=1 Tax=Phakopsora pachyrhizi TaxID=170000 RepID=A0AAV0APV3_PHAPC|nr:expressed protein [Phakopsora pachyrhizi]